MPEMPGMHKNWQLNRSWAHEPSGLEIPDKHSCMFNLLVSVHVKKVSDRNWPVLLLHTQANTHKLTHIHEHTNSNRIMWLPLFKTVTQKQHTIKIVKAENWTPYTRWIFFKYIYSVTFVLFKIHQFPSLFFYVLGKIKYMLQKWLLHTYSEWTNTVNEDRLVSLSWVYIYILLKLLIKLFINCSLIYLRRLKL